MKIKHILFLPILIALFIGATDPVKDFTGFKESSAQSQRKWETRFDSLLKATDIDQFDKYLSAHPHHLGSKYDRENTDYLVQQFRSWGFTVRIDTFYALFPTPKTRMLEEVSPVSYKASLVEPAIKEDVTSSQLKEQLPTYNAYSADGD